MPDLLNQRGRIATSISLSTGFCFTSKSSSISISRVFLCKAHLIFDNVPQWYSLWVALFSWYVWCVWVFIALESATASCVFEQRPSDVKTSGQTSFILCGELWNQCNLHWFKSQNLFRCYAEVLYTEKLVCSKTKHQLMRPLQYGSLFSLKVKNK